MGQPHPSRTRPPQHAASRTTTNARTHPPSGEQRVLRHVPFPGPQQRHRPDQPSHQPDDRRTVVANLPRPRPHHRPDGHCRATARNSPYRPGASPTPSSIYNSSVTRPTMNPTPSSPPSTAPCTSTEPSPRSLASPRPRWTSGCTSPRSHWSGRGSGPTRTNKSYNRTHQPGASPTG